MAAVPQHDPKLREIAKELYLQGLGPTAISKRILVPIGTIGQWIRRLKWQRNPLVLMPVDGLHAKGDPLANSSVKAKALLANILLKQLDVLAAKRVTESGLRTEKSIQGDAALAKTIADTCAIAFDWNREKPQGAVVIIGDMRDTQPLHALSTPSLSAPSESSTPSDAGTCPDTGCSQVQSPQPPKPADAATTES